MANLSVYFIQGFANGGNGFNNSYAPGYTYTGATLSWTTANLPDSFIAAAINLVPGNNLITSTGVQGTNCHHGFKIKVSALPTSRSLIWQNDSNVAAYLYLNTNGTLDLEDYTNTVRITTSAISTGTWYAIQVALASGLGDAYVYINGSEAGSSTSFSFNTSSVGMKAVFNNPTGSGITAYYVTATWAAGESTGTFPTSLDDWTVHAPSHANSGTTAEFQCWVTAYSTGTLAAGTWSAIDTKPWTFAQKGSLSGTADTDGYGGANDYDGPADTNYGNANAFVLGVQMHVMAIRGNGSGSVHRGIIANDTLTATQLVPTTYGTGDLALNASGVEYRQACYDDTNIRCPTITENLRAGFWKDDGGRDFNIHASRFELLIELPAATGAGIPPVRANQAHHHMLVR